MGIFDQIKDAAQAHGVDVGQGIDKVGDLVDEQTGGQYAAQVDQAQDFLKGQLRDQQPEVGASSEQAVPDTLQDAEQEQV